MNGVDVYDVSKIRFVSLNFKSMADEEYRSHASYISCSYNSLKQNILAGGRKSIFYGMSWI